MATFANPSQRSKPEMSVVSLTTVQQALWQLGIPILDAGAVATHKKRAKLVMLWRAIRWQLLAMAVLVGLICLGRQWGRAGLVAAAAVVLATLFGWLLNVSELQWLTLTYSTYQTTARSSSAGFGRGQRALIFGHLSQTDRCGVSEKRSHPVCRR